MIILILALLFGAAVLAFSLYSFKKAKKNSNSRLVSVLRLVVMFEALVYLLIFVYVFFKTLIM